MHFNWPSVYFTAGAQNLEAQSGAPNSIGAGHNCCKVMRTQQMENADVCCSQVRLQTHLVYSSWRTPARQIKPIPSLLIHSSVLWALLQRNAGVFSAEAASHNKTAHVQNNLQSTGDVTLGIWGFIVCVSGSASSSSVTHREAKRIPEVQQRLNLKVFRGIPQSETKTTLALSRLPTVLLSLAICKCLKACGMCKLDKQRITQDVVRSLNRKHTQIYDIT